jgi:uncharacterized OB-fold protein
MPSTKGKPLPQITDLTNPFWSAAKHGKLVLQKCSKCSTFNFFPRPWCIECGSRALAWADAKPYGTVYTFTISHIVSMNYPGWEAELPVLMCLIDLDDGVRLYGQVTDCAPEQLKIGMRVQAYFDDISDTAGIPKFRPMQ